MNPFMMHPWFMPPGSYGNVNYGTPNPPPSYPLPALETPTPQSRKHERELPSSDPPDSVFAEPYPEIENFLKSLAADHPKRKLEEYIATFDSHDYYHVDELIGISKEYLTGPAFGMSAGNAEFVLREAAREVQRIDKIRVKDRKRTRKH